MKKMFMTKAQVLCAYLGQQVILTNAIETETRLYPVGAVGMLEAIEMDGKGGAQARVTFENDPLQDLVTVPLDDIMPTEFLPEGCSLQDVEIPYSPKYKSSLVTN